MPRAHRDPRRKPPQRSCAPPQNPVAEAASFGVKLPTCFAVQPLRTGHPALGFTLLEVIFALALLRRAAPKLSEALRAAYRSAEAAESYTRAELIAASTMSELVAGATPLQSAQNVPSQYDPAYAISITFNATPVEGLVSVSVTVSRIEAGPRPI